MHRILVIHMAFLPSKWNFYSTIFGLKLMVLKNRLEFKHIFFLKSFYAGRWVLYFLNLCFSCTSMKVLLLGTDSTLRVKLMVEQLIDCVWNRTCQWGTGKMIWDKHSRTINHQNIKSRCFLPFCLFKIPISFFDK